MPNCGVLNCSNRSSKESTIRFFTFPKYTTKNCNSTLNFRQKIKNKQFEAWIRAVNRVSVGANVKICSKHFSSGKPAHWCDVKNIDWFPHIDMGYDLKVHSLDYLRKHAIPLQKNVIIVDETGTTIPKLSSLPVSTTSQFSLRIPRVEVHGSNGAWQSAKLTEADTEDKEVLVKSENNIKSEEPETLEWKEYTLYTSRLSPFPDPVAAYMPGEKCLARKCPVIVQKVLENNTYEVRCGDGIDKVVRADELSKLKAVESAKTPKTITPAAVVKTKPPVPLSISKFDSSKLNLPPVPRDDKWCCNWVNRIPVGIKCQLKCRNGYRGPSVIVEDWRLPAGWIKHMHPRSNTLEKWEVMLIGPNGKRFRSTNDVKVYFEERGEVYNPDIYDFNAHEERAKDLGLYVFTEDYKGELKNRKLFAAKARKVRLRVNLFCCPEPGCDKKLRNEYQLRNHIRQYHKDPPIDESVVENGMSNAGPIPVAIYRTQNFEHREQVDTFVIS